MVPVMSLPPPIADTLGNLRFLVSSKPAVRCECTVVGFGPKKVFLEENRMKNKNKKWPYCDNDRSR